MPRLSAVGISGLQVGEDVNDEYRPHRASWPLRRHGLPADDQGRQVAGARLTAPVVVAQRWGIAPAALWVCAALTLGGPALAADPMPYSLALAPTGQPSLDRVLADASRLAGLRERAPVGPFALIARAEADVARLDTVLRSFGYYDAGIAIRIAGRDLADSALLPLLEDLPADRPVTVTVAFDLGPLYRLGEVRLEGVVTPAARAVFTLRPAEPARAARILAAGEAVLRVLREDGFALARVPPPDAVVDHDTRTMDVAYLAQSGPRLALGEVTVTGLERLREGYVLRRLGLTPGDIYNPTRLEAARRDLLAGGALAWARLTPGDAPDTQGRLPLALEVAERPPRVLRLGAAWSSDEGGTLSGSWSHRNLFGGAERLDLDGEVGGLGENRVSSLNYLASAALRIPDLWIRNLDLRLNLAGVSEFLDAYDRDAMTAGAALERRLSERLSASAGLAYERSRVVQDGLAENYHLLSLPLTLSYDDTDDPLAPRRGLRLAARLAPVQALGSEGQGFVVARVAASAYLDLSGGHWYRQRPASSPEDPAGAGGTVIAGRLVIGSIQGAESTAVPPDWRFYAGGGGSVRGYPFQSIGPKTSSGSPAGGDGLLEAGLELRQRIGKTWGAVAFVDTGAVSEDGIPGAAALCVGVGAGLRYYTPIGPVRVDVATPLNRAAGDSPLQLYLGIGHAF